MFHHVCAPRICINEQTSVKYFSIRLHYNRTIAIHPQLSLVSHDPVQCHGVRGKQSSHEHRHSPSFPCCQHHVQMSIHKRKGVNFYRDFLNEVNHDTPEHVAGGSIGKTLAYTGGMGSDMQGDVGFQRTIGMTHENSKLEVTQCSSRHQSFQKTHLSS